MNRERIKELLPIIKAFAEGKTIQVLSYSGNWCNIEDMQFYDKNKYRIKPEAHLRPYTFEEMREAVKKHGGYIHQGDTSVWLIQFIDEDGILYNDHDGASYTELVNEKFMWLDDNSPCGIMM